MNISQAREDDGHLNGNHAEVLIGLHDFLDAGEQVVVLEIGGGLDLAVLLHLEDLELLLRHGGGRVGAAYAAVGGSG
jgi:hypothetical protein